MLRGFLGRPALVPMNVRLFAELRTTLRDLLRTTLDTYLTPPAAGAAPDAAIRFSEPGDAELARMLRAKITDDISIGMLLQTMAQVTWDDRLKNDILTRIVGQLGLFSVILDRAPHHAELALAVWNDATTRAELLNVVFAVLSPLRTLSAGQVEKFSTPVSFIALRDLMVEAYKEQDEAYRTNLATVVTNARTALNTALNAYIAAIDAKTATARASGFLAEVALFSSRTTGEESGPYGQTCARVMLRNLDTEPLSFYQLLHHASHTWGSHSNAMVMGILVDHFDILRRLRDNLTAAQLPVFYKIVQSAITEALKALPESLRDHFGLAHLHHLKDDIRRKCGAEPRLNIDRAAGAAGAAGGAGGAEAPDLH